MRRSKYLRRAKVPAKTKGRNWEHFGRAENVKKTTMDFQVWMAAEQQRRGCVTYIQRVQLARGGPKRANTETFRENGSPQDGGSRLRIMYGRNIRVTERC